MRFYTYIIISLISTALFSQSDWALADLDQLFDDQEYSKYLFEGYLEKSLPLTVAIGKIDSEVMGYVYYGQNRDRYDLLGTMKSSGDLVLYEFDNYDRVVGKISGDVVKPLELFTWHNPDESLKLNLVLHNIAAPQFEVQVFEDKNEPHYSHIFMREGLRQITLNRPIPQLKWSDFMCDQAECSEIESLGRVNSPIDFALINEGNKESLIAPQESLVSKYTIAYNNTSKHTYKGYHSSNYPVLNDVTFDTWVSNVIQDQNLEPQDEDAERALISERLDLRHINDFYLTLVSKNLISGFIYSVSNHSNQVYTKPFIFDMNKSKFYGIGDIFRKDFDYAYFLTNHLKSIKREQLSKENRSIQKVIEAEDYKHYTLTPEGLLFFTDFNVIFGRRKVLVSYDEIQDYIDNKTIENYLKKERK